ncbi:MAG: acylphosphatase, partial [Candidatus Nanohaloarchaea archaeon]|nr:acylphosphatase [Candidatus Nanohaloarchaea archaeon]
RDEAREKDVNGWVRNLDDGRVEAVFEGGDEAVEEMVEFCREGPETARVEDVEVEYGEPKGLDGFRVKR